MIGSYKRIIPCLDLKDGLLVKGIKFEELKELGEAQDYALRYFRDGADEIAFLDISSSQKSRAALVDLIKKARAEINIPLCAGGGVKTIKDMEELLNAGADKVSLCSAALERPELISEMASLGGSGAVVLAIDAKRVNRNSWNAYSAGGRTDTGMDAVEWARKGQDLGAGEIMLNSIDADGTAEGYDLELCSAISNAVSIPVIASGGAGSLEQIGEVLTKTNVNAALTASLLHYGKSTVREIKKYLESQKVDIRW